MFYIFPFFEGIKSPPKQQFAQKKNLWDTILVSGLYASLGCWVCEV